jgi:hypothetical protein
MVFDCSRLFSVSSHLRRPLRAGLSLLLLTVAPYLPQPRGARGLPNWASCACV